MRSLPISRTARRRFRLDSVAPAATAGPRLAAGIATARRVTAAVNATRRAGEPSAQAGELAALELLHEIFHLLVRRAGDLVPPSAMSVTAQVVEESVGQPVVDELLVAVGNEFPDVEGRPEPVRLEELLLVRIANENPAARPLRDLVDDSALPPVPRAGVLGAVEAYQAGLTPIGPNGETLVELLRAPARAHPTSLAGQLRYVRDQWRDLLGDELDALLDRMLLTLDVMVEEERGLHLRFGGGAGDGTGHGEAPDLSGLDAEPERFSSDSAWMPRLVLIAKSTHVWLDQLSRRYERDIRTLDAIPDEELDRLARWGITGLWLIGLWERSRASQRIKAWRGNPDAAASAYSLDDYRIADDLGGEGAWSSLRHRAWTRGLRLASDMVPNHMGIDSHWVVDHPEWFLSLPEPPYPGYTFGGGNLADDERVEVRIEDHYWDNSDAAVVFERRDRTSGERRYIYHGNDGTSFPWNDTAQLDFSQAAVREQVIRTILDVARRFPVIRFDAAMVLAKKHVRRLWFPAPGEGGGAIPSRAEHGTMTAAEFDAAMPNEFWREVVDRVAAEVPDTLLLAEAFWLLEGYFVRTLGMHRVYNSAFMHMLRDEDNAGYRRVLKETLEFDPEILKRYVNFMNNPDEKSAVEQFGKGDKYVGVATLLATLPGLPMFGHGQFEGFGEKYGMEFRRATPGRARGRVAGRAPRARDRPAPAPPRGLRRGARLPAVRRRPRLRRRATRTCSPTPTAPAALARWSSTTTGTRRRRAGSGTRLPPRSRTPTARSGSVRRSLAEGLGLADGPADGRWLGDARAALRPRAPAVRGRDPGARPARLAPGVRVPGVLGPARAARTPPGSGAGWPNGSAAVGVPSLEGALRELQLAPVHDALRAAIADPSRAGLERLVAAVADATGTAGDRDAVAGRIETLAGRAAPVIGSIADPSQEAALRIWVLLSPLGSLAEGAPVGPTSRAWYEELRLAPVVADGLRGHGLDEGGAWWAAERVRTLLDLPLPSGPGGTAASQASRLVDAWLAHPAVRPFIRVNAWDGVEWFHRESFDELLTWMDRLERLQSETDRHGRSVVRESAVHRRLAEAAESSRLSRRRAAPGARGNARRTIDREADAAAEGAGPRIAPRA